MTNHTDADGWERWRAFLLAYLPTGSAEVLDGTARDWEILPGIYTREGDEITYQPHPTTPPNTQA